MLSILQNYVKDGCLFLPIGLYNCMRLLFGNTFRDTIKPAFFLLAFSPFIANCFIEILFNERLPREELSKLYE